MKHLCKRHLRNKSGVKLFKQSSSGAVGGEKYRPLKSILASVVSNQVVGNKK
jgi:hypothetical protein